MKYGIAIDSARCMACYACFMACKDEHCGWDTTVSKAQPHMGQFWMNIKEWERGDNERRIKTATVPTPCSHCDHPACMAAAKDGAVYKREDGIVIIDPVKAKGQRQIVDACPMGALRVEGDKLRLDPDKCNNCGRCYRKCPFKAGEQGEVRYQLENIDVGGALVLGKDQRVVYAEFDGPRPRDIKVAVYAD